MQVLEAASQTFTLLSDELQRKEEEELHQSCHRWTHRLRDRREDRWRSHLETKWLWSGEKATFRTQEPWPLSVAARLACCLQHKTRAQHLLLTADQLQCVPVRLVTAAVRTSEQVKLCG